MHVSDPDWNRTEPEQDGATSIDASEQSPPDLHRNFAAAAQWFFVQDKIMPGVVLRGGHQWIWVHLEGALLFTTKSSPALDGPTLGNQFGTYLSLSPLNTERIEVHLGIGGDYYWLWGIHGDQWEVAFSTRLSGHYWLTRQLGAFGAVRAYPASTEGLELGTTRSGESGLPVLLALGVEWRP